MVRHDREASGYDYHERLAENIRKMLKSLFRTTSQKVFKGKDEHKKKKHVNQYLQQARMLVVKVEELTKHPPVKIGGEEQQILTIIKMLRKYKRFVTKFTDQIGRRLLKGEVIATEDKIISIFEGHTE